MTCVLIYVLAFKWKWIACVFCVSHLGIFIFIRFQLYLPSTLIDIYRQSNKHISKFKFMKIKRLTFFYAKIKCVCFEKCCFIYIFFGNFKSIFKIKKNYKFYLNFFHFQQNFPIARSKLYDESFDSQVWLVLLNTNSKFKSLTPFFVLVYLKNVIGCLIML